MKMTPPLSYDLYSLEPRWADTEFMRQWTPGDRPGGSGQAALTNSPAESL
jgi:hypothetical protein